MKETVADWIRSKGEQPRQKTDARRWFADNPDAREAAKQGYADKCSNAQIAAHLRFFYGFPFQSDEMVTRAWQ